MEDDAITVIMHEPQASASRTETIIASSECAKLKYVGLTKCVIMNLLLITQPSANQVAGLLLLSHSNV